MKRLKQFWDGLGAPESAAVPCLLALLLVMIHLALIFLGLGGALGR